MAQEKSKEERQSRTPLWKKVLIVAAAVLVLLGIGLKVHGLATRPEKAPPPAGTGAPVPKGAQGFTEGPGNGTDRPSAEVPQESKPGLGEKASPFLLSGGISFFVGLAIGTALRVFFKAALVITGIAVLGIAGLSYAGVIGPIDWQGIEKWMDLRLTEAEQKTAGFRDYLLLSLPSAGMAGAGVVAGFKRK